MIELRLSQEQARLIEEQFPLSSEPTRETCIESGEFQLSWHLSKDVSLRFDSLGNEYSLLISTQEEQDKDYSIEAEECCFFSTLFHCALGGTCNGRLCHKAKNTNQQPLL